MYEGFAIAKGTMLTCSLSAIAKPLVLLSTKLHIKFLRKWLPHRRLGGLPCQIY